MTYLEVLQARGLPSRIFWHRETTVFVYWDRTLKEFTTLWFEKGRVAFCSGETLSKDDQLIAKRSQELPLPLEELSYDKSQALARRRYWPQVGLTIGTTSDRIESLALRDSALPVEPRPAPAGSSVSGPEPWFDQFSEDWLMDGMALGDSRTQVLRTLGKPLTIEGERESYPDGLVVTYAPGGFVWRLEGGSSVSFPTTCGWHQGNDGPFKIGAPLDRSTCLHDRSVSFPCRLDETALVENGWCSPVKKLRVYMVDGLARRFELSPQDQDLLKTLREYTVNQTGVP